MAKTATVKLYADGLCSGNPGPGGWACILVYKGHKREFNGGNSFTTNNRMEMMALLSGLKALRRSCVVEAFTDSHLVRNAIQQNWIARWKKNGWKGFKRKNIANVDLWVKIDELLQIHSVTINWTPGHSGVPDHDRCDYLAKKTAHFYKNKNQIVQGRGVSGPTPNGRGYLSD